MIKAPFPWFGGKSRCAEIVWRRFGDVPNYVEPFLGSAAVLLARPHEPRIETANDKDCYLANFWRAVQFAPDEVARYADGPVNEADLHARHKWLVAQTDFRTKMMADPHYFDAKIAGWWVWGISQWIGSGWCSKPEWSGRANAGRAHRGIHAENFKSDEDVGRTREIANASNWKKRPNLRRGGVGVHRVSWSEDANEYTPTRQMPDLGGDGSSGRGIHAPTLARRGTASRMGQWETRPFLSSAGQGVTIRENLLDFMLRLQDRLRRVRICCGDWERVLGRSPTTCVGLTGVFLDPPYSREAGRDPSIYSAEDLDVAVEVRKWAIEHGEDPKMRIALCGYDGEHTMPRGWTVVAWKANGGYGNQGKGKGKENAIRERIWFSPYCVQEEGMLL